MESFDVPTWDGDDHHQDKLAERLFEGPALAAKFAEESTLFDESIQNENGDHLDVEPNLTKRKRKKGSKKSKGTSNVFVVDHKNGNIANSQQHQDGELRQGKKKKKKRKKVKEASDEKIDSITDVLNKKKKVESIEQISKKESSKKHCEITTMKVEDSEVLSNKNKFESNANSDLEMIEAEKTVSRGKKIKSKGGKMGKIDKETGEENEFENKLQSAKSAFEREHLKVKRKKRKENEIESSINNSMIQNEENLAGKAEGDKHKAMKIKIKDNNLLTTNSENNEENKSKLKNDIENLRANKEIPKVLHIEKSSPDTCITVENGKTLKIKDNHSSRISARPNNLSNKLKDRLKKKLDGAQFRWINEKLYTTKSDNSLSMFRENPSLFDVYHKGFQSQVESWPENPVDVFIRQLQESSDDLIVADLGCGEAKIAQSVKQKVFSFDLAAKNDFVTVADMAKLPLKTGSTDIAIFCLSLMGVNVAEFLKEAKRILKTGGTLKIAEVVSRIEDLQEFVDNICCLGFKLIKKDESNKMFVLMEFEKTKESKQQDTPQIKLKPCIYKRR